MSVRNIGYLAFSCFLVSASTLIIDNWDYYRRYRHAEAKAELTIGDKKHPLNKSERKIWYELMGVPKGRDPTREQLDNF